MSIRKKDNLLAPTPMTSPAPMSSPSQRLIGLDILRILAAYGVVVIHGIAGIPKDATAEKFAQIFSTASVPTFLIMAFYFGMPKLLSEHRGQFLRERFSRLLIPCYAWSGIYLSARLAQQLLFHDHSFSKIFNQPFSLLLGNASVQLYFLPMLFCGIVAATLLTQYHLLRHPIVLVIQLITSLELNILASKVPNLGNLDGTTLDVQLLNMGLLCLLWALRCLPYILIVLLIKHHRIDQLMLTGGKRSSFALLAMTFCMFGVIIFAGWPIPESIVATIILLTGIGISPLLHQHLSITSQRLVGAVSRLTFGIYLLHCLLSEGVYPLLRKMNLLTQMHSMSLAMLLGVSALIFLVSFVIVRLIARSHFLSKILLSA